MAFPATEEVRESSEDHWAEAGMLSGEMIPHEVGDVLVFQRAGPQGVEGEGFLAGEKDEEKVPLTSHWLDEPATARVEGVMIINPVL
jgi:hypothetical protein